MNSNPVTVMIAGMKNYLYMIEMKTPIWNL